MPGTVSGTAEINEPRVGVGASGRRGSMRAWACEALTVMTNSNNAVAMFASFQVNWHLYIEARALCGCAPGFIYSHSRWERPYSSFDAVRGTNERVIAEVSERVTNRIRLWHGVSHTPSSLTFGAFEVRGLDFGVWILSEK